MELLPHCSGTALPKMPNSPDIAATLAYSRYATGALAVRPEERAELEAAIDTPFEWGRAGAAIDGSVSDGDAAALAAALRTLRRRVFMHTLARDLTGRADFAEVCANMTRLAETALNGAVRLHHRALVALHGEPRDDDGQRRRSSSSSAWASSAAASSTSRPTSTSSSSIRMTARPTARALSAIASSSNGSAGA